MVCMYRNRVASCQSGNGEGSLGEFGAGTPYMTICGRVCQFTTHLRRPFHKEAKDVPLPYIYFLTLGRYVSEGV